MCVAELSNMTDLWLSGVFSQALNIPKLVFRRGSAPDPAGEFTMLLQSPDS